MLGIFGYIKNDCNSLLNKMVQAINQFKQPKILFEYCDSNIEFSQYTLNLYKNNYINKDDVFLAIEGKCYNFYELNKEFNLNFQYFSEIILWAYSNKTLPEVLKRINGCFHFCLYDKKNKKLILANDRFGLKPLFLYSKDNNFAFSCDVKTLLPLNFIDRTLNNNAFSMFADLGYLLGDNTWFKNIRRMKPATIVEYDIDKKSIEYTRYWTFKEVKKSNISFESAVDKAYELFNQSILRQLDLNYNYAITLSGGFDSRLILAAVKQNFPDYKPYIMTFGIENCQDIITAEKICKIAKLNHNKLLFDNDFDWFHKRFKFVFASNCSFSLQDMHGLEFSDKYPKQIQINMNGYLGDTVLGRSYLPVNKKLYNLRSNKEIAQYYYDKHYEFSDYNNEYFEIDNPIVLHWMNRGTNFINEALNCVHSVDIIRPFFDNDLIEFISSINNEYLEDNKLYRHMVLKYYPKYFKGIPRNSYKPTFIKKDIHYRIQKIKYSFEKKLRKWHFLPEIINSYADYMKWVKEPKLNSEIKNLILNKNTIIQNYIDTNEIEQCFKDLNNFQNVRKILNLASVEIYFNRIRLNMGTECIKIPENPQVRS